MISTLSQGILSLVGLDETLLTHPLNNLLDDQEFKNTLDLLAESYKGKVGKIRELLGRMKLEDTVEAYRSLVETYSLESGEQAVKLRDVLERIRNKLYEVINNSYLDFLHQKSTLGKTDFEQISKDMSNRIPLHWKIDFQSVLSDGGFDVVIGNPPYIEDNMYDKTDLKIIGCQKESKRTKNKDTEALVYYSKDCGNTHAYFIERSIRLLKPSGSFAFIVPISLVSTNRMGSIRQFIHQNSSEAKYFNFDDRPGKIFSGIEHCRSTIVVTKKGKGVQEITTNKYNRWLSENRHVLFENLKTIDWGLQNPREVLPKIGTNVEKEILEKMAMKSSGKTVGDFVNKTGFTIWYHNAPQYWIHAHTEDYLPKIEYYSGYTRNKSTGEIFPN